MSAPDWEEPSACFQPDADETVYPSEQNSEFGNRVQAILEESQSVYAERNAVYKDNFRSVGKVMAALFPDGRPPLSKAAEYDRWHIFELLIVKLTRYANGFDTPHEDSLLDMIPYLGILGGLDQELREREGIPTPQSALQESQLAIQEAHDMLLRVQGEFRTVLRRLPDNNGPLGEAISSGITKEEIDAAGKMMSLPIANEILKQERDREDHPSHGHARERARIESVTEYTGPSVSVDLRSLLVGQKVDKKL